MDDLSHRTDKSDERPQAPGWEGVVMLLFEGVWALHTTVIIAADQREVGNLVRGRASKIARRGQFC